MNALDKARMFGSGYSALLRRAGELTAWVYLAIFAMTFFEVVLRYGFSSPTSWTIDVALLLAAIHFLVGGASASACDGHFRIDVAIRLLPPPVVAVLDRVRQFITAAVCFGLLYWAWPQAARSLARNERLPSGLDLPTPMIVKTLIAVVLAAILIHAVLALFGLQERSDREP